ARHGTARHGTARHGTARQQVASIQQGLPTLGFSLKFTSVSSMSPNMDSARSSSGLFYCLRGLRGRIVFRPD
ncbi:hypothetical protein OEJ37_27520, partial [Burkholderia sp. BKH01]|uniref:hypothetical protein n=1 Tax=Burkholderia sp. BKH01 TaxID=2769262 RepID=UPI0021E0539A